MKHKSADSVRRIFRRKRGQGIVEYAFLVGLISLVVLAALVTMGTQLADFFISFTNRLMDIMLISVR